ncbi:cyclin-dependent kinase B1-1 [Panicum miliaceum]|uniref:Cyclin-dependent kinase B1-1 n=1 Tax=Panicum miliaceum TaxID=4540 RepID=A0A3L6PJR1_PANMI|nr:cyclin-dependent kinase B1-1 [Panicum miliaceum]
MEINIVDKYEKLEKVGEGTYGKVYKAQDKATGQLVALKKTRLEMDEEGIPPTALREISLLNLLSHSIYVVRLLAVEQAAKNGKPILYLVFEFLDTDLKKYLDVYRRGPSPRPLPPHLVKTYTDYVLQDLKPQNLLVDKEKGILKIADLGLGRAFTVPMKSYTHEIVTLWYRAPEVLLGATHYSTGVDMWSVGCIFGMPVLLLSLDAQCILYYGFTEICFWKRLLGTPTEEQWPGKMLQLDPANRISAIAAMDHPYFNSLDKSQF